MPVRSRGYLPHVDTPGLVQHIVFRTADSLPRGWSESGEHPDAAWLSFDAALDRGGGRCALAHPQAASAVCAALTYFAGERYDLFAWCVMPNHVHVVIQARNDWSLSKVVHSWKSFTANAVNAEQRRSGAVWAREWYDRYMRDEAQLQATVAYVESNPVKAGLVASPSDWRWSSAWRDGA